ncbi:MAG: hypothetical protein H6702_23650 [Myxococcales bacterium]|nr:hypothetical protein [Myxococcales bacterium]
MQTPPRTRSLAPLALLWPLLFMACDDSAGSGGTTPRDMGEVGVCRFNSDCPPGYYCKERRCDLDCRTSRDCPPGQSCESGECLGAQPDRGAPPDMASPQCRADADCAPPSTVCESGACVPGCATTGCGAGQTCGADTGRCAAFDCRRDGCPDGQACDRDTGACVSAPPCDPPCAEDEYCDLDLRRCVLRQTCADTGCPDGWYCDGQTGMCLEPDCNRDGCLGQRVCNEQSGQCEDPPFDCRNGDPCGAGERCDEQTGRCLGRAALGERCDRAFHCASDMCVGSPQNPNLAFCTQLCCSENDCPAGFGCLYGAGVRYCVPAALVPTSNFSASAGQDCSRVNDCRTGICGPRDRCMGSCCTDADCLGAVCELLPTGDGSARGVCDIGNIGLGGPAGSPCFSELDCLNRLCVPIPGGNGGAPGYCAPSCCTHADCGGGLLCGQVLVGQRGDYIHTACVPLEAGPRADGAGCLSDSDCQSGHCVEDFCRQPCCYDQHCANGLRCLPRANGEGSLVRACVPPDVPAE